MAVGRQGLTLRIPRQVPVVATMPEGQGQDAHERAVAVVLLVARTGLLGRLSRAQGREGAHGLHAAVEDEPVDGEVPLGTPTHQPPGEVVEVEPAFLQERCQQAQRLGPVVRPRPRGTVSWLRAKPDGGSSSISAGGGTREAGVNS